MKYVGKNGLEINGKEVWHEGNFVPESKQDKLGYTPVDKAGDTMTGALTLSGAPTSNLHAATKKYVDDNAGGGGGTKIITSTTEPTLATGDQWHKEI